MVIENPSNAREPGMLLIFATVRSLSNITSSFLQNFV